MINFNGFKSNDVKNKKYYKKNQLNNMTTYQLKEIAFNERITIANIKDLNRELLIKKILQYRGIEDNLFISKYNQNAFSNLYTYIKNSKKNKKIDKNFNYKEKMKIFKDLEIDYSFDYKLNSDKNLEQGNILLVDDEFNLCSILNLKKINEEFYITKDKSMKIKTYDNHHYSLLYLDNKESEMIYDIYENTSKNPKEEFDFYKLPLLDLKIKDLEISKAPLVINIGSKNSILGTFDIDELDTNKSIKIAKITKNTDKNKIQTPLISTAIAIKKINNANSKQEFKVEKYLKKENDIDLEKEKQEEIEYIFSYEAIEKYKENMKDINLFFNLKRWFNNPYKYEEIKDNNGNKIEIQRIRLIEKYIEYLIEVGRTYFKKDFKNLNFVFSIKEKERYMQIIKKDLTDINSKYHIEEQNSIDETTGTLFNSIHNLIKKDVYKDNQKYKALIIDIGSRKSNLNSCEFKIENKRISYEIDIQSNLLNSKIDFGGDSIDYKIFKYLKIQLAHIIRLSDIKEKYRYKNNSNINIDENIEIDLLNNIDKDIYKFIDDNEDIDYNFNSLYEKAKDIIPTKYKNYTKSNLKNYYKIKQNYYYLMELARKIKEEFYKNNNVYEIILSFDEKYKDNIKKNTIYIDRWKINRLKESELIQLDELQSLNINIFEIKKLIQSDIYKMMKDFLEQLYIDNEIPKYSLIKLSGLSSNITVFREVLKEFVPGRIIEFKNTKDLYELKLNSIKGVLNFLYLKKLGFIDYNIESKILKIPYKITAYTHTNEEKIIIKALQGNITNNISRFMGESIILKLYLKDNNDNVLREFIYKSKLKDYKEITPKEIEEKYKDIIYQFETDSIRNKEIKFFIWQDVNLFGFNIIPILRDEEQLYIGSKKVCLFEDDSWEIDYYDGLK
ncbi:MAG: hypothetical protein N4A54_06530 [Peptostreptococcaceae bacterium]|jgi:hypothetical protein|nr:hypothetical protein [Peptostreptococcaceae bacterium]